MEGEVWQVLGEHPGPLLCLPQPWHFTPHGGEPQLLSRSVRHMCFIGLKPIILNCHAENSCRNQ